MFQASSPAVHGGHLSTWLKAVTTPFLPKDASNLQHPEQLDTELDELMARDPNQSDYYRELARIFGSQFPLSSPRHGSVNGATSRRRPGRTRPQPRVILISFPSRPRTSARKRTTQIQSYRKELKDFTMPCKIFASTQIKENIWREKPEKNSTKNSSKATLS